MVRVVGRLVEIQDQRRPDDAGRLVELAVQLAGPGGRPPVDAVERIARLVPPHAGDAGGIFVEAVRNVDLADRPPRGQLEALQRHHLGIDQQEVRRGEHAVAAVQAEQVARLDHQRADLVVAAAIALELITQCVAGRGPAASPTGCVFPSLASWAAGRERPAGQQVLGQHPDHRQPARVLQGDRHRDRLADLRRVARCTPARPTGSRSTAVPAIGSSSIVPSRAYIA